jgi:hypothetical protein
VPNSTKRKRIGKAETPSVVDVDEDEDMDRPAPVSLVL